MEDTITLVTDNKEAELLTAVPPTKKLRILSEQDLKERSFTFNETSIVAITTESVIDAVKDNIIGVNKKRAITLLKDKVLFRETVAPFFPDFTFRKIAVDDLANCNISKKMVVKPQKGFFATAVKIIDENSNLKTIAKVLKEELLEKGKLFSDAILSSTTLILEDYIDGEEYAVDMYYDNEGTPHILNIYAHPSPRHKEYLHMMYYTSRTIFNQLEEKVIQFYTNLNTILKVKNFPIHGEFKNTSSNKLIPIEMNPLRFGGMGLGNMVYYSIGLNPYEAMINKTPPNWKAIWSNEKHKNSIYTYVIAYNGKTVDIETHKPNLEKIRREFSTILNETHLNYKEGLVFGLFSLKETQESINRILELDFDDFFEKI